MKKVKYYKRYLAFTFLPIILNSCGFNLGPAFGEDNCPNDIPPYVQSVFDTTTMSETTELNNLNDFRNAEWEYLVRNFSNNYNGSNCYEENDIISITSITDSNIVFIYNGSKTHQIDIDSGFIVIASTLPTAFLPILNKKNQQTFRNGENLITVQNLEFPNNISITAIFSQEIGLLYFRKYQQFSSSSWHINTYLLKEFNQRKINLDSILTLQNNI